MNHTTERKWVPIKPSRPNESIGESRRWRSVTKPEALSNDSTSGESRKVGEAALAPFAYNAAESKGEIFLPRSFENAATMRGHSVEDLVSKMTDCFENPGGFGPVFTFIRRGNTQPMSSEDRQFLRNEGSRYEQAILQFGREVESRSPSSDTRSAVTEQIGFLQVDSPAFVKHRIQGGTDSVTSRIYLNPPLDKTVEIYREIFEEAERRDIAFRSKVFDFELRSSQRPESKIENIIDNGKIMRTDPVVFYGLASSQDELLGVVNKVYAKYRQSFKDRDTGSIPLQVAPGFALGAEPGVDGYSLTSHREEVMGRLLNALSETDWKLLDVGKRMSTYEERLRQAFILNNIDPDNIAFNLTQN